MKELRVSLPDDVYASLIIEAGRHGFLGRYAGSGYLRHLAFEAVSKRQGEPDPIVVPVRSSIIRIDYTAYSVAKGRASLEAWVAEAMATERNRNVLTARQQAVFEQTYAFLIDPAKALQL